MGHANLRFWKAWKDSYVEPRSSWQIGSREDRRTLIVTGRAEVEDDVTPTLEELDAAPELASETGHSDPARILHLGFLSLKPGNSWKTVWFQKEIELDDYGEVHLHIPTGEESDTVIMKLFAHQLNDK